MGWRPAFQKYDAGGGGGSGTIIAPFTYTATGAEGDSFPIALPGAPLATAYFASVQLGVNSTGIGIKGVPTSDYTDSQIVVDTTSAPAAGDTFIVFLLKAT